MFSISRRTLFSKKIALPSEVWAGSRVPVFHGEMKNLFSIWTPNDATHVVGGRVAHPHISSSHGRLPDFVKSFF